MLSFLKAQGTEPVLSQQNTSDADESGVDNNQQKQGRQYITVANNKHNVRRSTILLIGLFGIGFLLLFFMIKKSTPQTTSAAAVSEEQLQIEKAIAQLTGLKSGVFNRMDEVVNKFYEFSDVEQVKVEDLAKNPFQRMMFLDGLDAGSVSERSKGTQTEIMRRQLTRQAEEFELLSIMQSLGKNCCMIDDKILYEGDSIGFFKVKQIGDDFVKLICALENSQDISGAKLENIQAVLKLIE